jgi:molybdate/tungstate transport system substrate-binding protein
MLPGSAHGSVTPRRPSGTLTVFHAGSLRRSLGPLVESFRRDHPEVEVVLEGSASIDAVRKLTHDGRIPDLLLVADYSILPRVVVPSYADWHVQFGRNRIGLLHGDRSASAAQLDPQRWWATLLTPGVKTGMSDPVRDPAGYRTLLVFALAERHYGVPGLAAQLRAAIPPARIRSRST